MPGRGKRSQSGNKSPNKTPSKKAKTGKFNEGNGDRCSNKDGKVNKMKGKRKDEDTAVANFEESDEFVTMEASGLNTEFRSDESSSEDEETDTQGDKNNNATTTLGKAKHKKGGNKTPLHGPKLPCRC